VDEEDPLPEHAANTSDQARRSRNMVPYPTMYLSGAEQPSMWPLSYTIRLWSRSQEN